MSRWAEAFAAFSDGIDTSETSRHIEGTTPDVSRSVHSVTTAPEPSLLWVPERALDSRVEAEAERAAITELPPLLLADGRRLHRFHADAIPSSVSGDADALLDQARWHGAVLVADGTELIVVEQRQSSLAPEMLRSVKSCAGAVIAVLRGECRRRCADSKTEPRDR